MLKAIGFVARVISQELRPVHYFTTPYYASLGYAMWQEPFSVWLERDSEEVEAMYRNKVVYFDEAFTFRNVSLPILLGIEAHKALFRVINDKYSTYENVSGIFFEINRVFTYDERFQTILSRAANALNMPENSAITSIKILELKYNGEVYDGPIESLNVYLSRHPLDNTIMLLIETQTEFDSRLNRWRDTPVDVP